jgi:AraC-like DNA-binding protein
MKQQLESQHADDGDARPGPVPWDPSRPLFESPLVGIGTMRMSPGHSEMNRDRVAYVWPTVSFPRLPYSIRFDREDAVQGDRNTAVLTSVGSVMRRTGMTDRGIDNVWLDVHPNVLADMISAATGSSRDPDARFPWRYTPLPTAPLLAVTRLAARVRQQGGTPAMASPPDPARSKQAGGPKSLEIEETILGAIAATVKAAATAHAPTRRRPPSVAQAKFHREAIDEVRRRLAVAPEDRHSLTQLAAAVHVSPFHLCRLFKRHTGVPIHRYLERLRLRAAMVDAVETRSRMLDIALRHGFCSESHLSNAFLKEFGQRPSDVRCRKIA